MPIYPPEPTITWEQFLASFEQQILGALTDLRNGLVAAGVATNRITVESVENAPHLRYRITATRGSRTFIFYVEIVPTGTINDHMAITVNVWCEGNGSQISISYSPGAPAQYNIDVALEDLLTRVSGLAGTIRGELLVAAKGFLQV